MKSVFFAAFAICQALCGSAMAAERQALGWGYLLTNDVFWDRQDRWRTGSTVLSHLRGNEWSGSRPTSFGDLIEYRLRSEVISPENVTRPAANDRRYVGALSFGAHSHFERGGAEISVGVDLVFVGPQTGLDKVQDGLHDLFGGPDVNVNNFQVANAVYPTLTAELGRTISFGGAARFRPFVEFQAGAETLMRVGGDLTLGNFGQDNLLLRDATTGHLYTAMDDDNVGLSLMIGADAAFVADSRYLATPGVRAKNVRSRVRSGLVYAWSGGSLFYGATYLSREFEAQREGQVIGSLNARFDF